MAVVKMKLITARGQLDALEPVLGCCSARPDLHIEDASELTPGKAGVTFNEVNPYEPLISECDNLAALAGIKPSAESDMPPLSGEPGERLRLMREELEGLIAARGKLDGLIRDDERIIGQLSHLEGSGVDLDSVFTFEFFKIRFGHLPRESYESLDKYTAERDSFFFFASSVERTEVWGLYVAPKSKIERVDALFTSLHFERIYLSERAHGTPKEARQTLTMEIELSKNRLCELDARISELKARMKDEIGALRSYLTRMNGTFELRRNCLFDGDKFILMGWVERDSAEALKAELEALGAECTLEDPSPDMRAAPPTKLKNCLLFRPFEEFVTMYGLPSYNEIDPTPLVAISYMLFFGLMFGDLGQGAVIILAGLLMAKLKGMFIGRILMRVGVSSMIFGVFYGSVFGYEEIIHGFNPMENINTTLFGAVGIGAVFITVAMIFNIANAIKQRDRGRLFVSQNGIAGLIFYWAALLLVAGMLEFLPFDVPVLLVGAIIAVAVTAIFLRAPLGDLLERRRVLLGESKLDFILENFFELFEVVLSFVTNTISFIRIGAFALNHVGMMTVVFLLAETSSGQNPVIVVLGNLFIIGFEGMIVCIQALRLEFYELFGRFFEGEGREFLPAADAGRAYVGENDK